MCRGTASLRRVRGFHQTEWLPPPDKTHSRSSASAATARVASCNSHERPFGILVAQAGDFLLLNCQHQFYGLDQVFPARGFGPALSVGTGDFRTKADKPFSVPLDDGRKLAG